MRWARSARLMLVAIGAIGGGAACATTDAETRVALLVTVNTVGTARCGGPIARHAKAEIVSRSGDDRYGGGRAILSGSTGDGTACSGEVLFSYVRRDTPIALFGGQISVQNAVVVSDGPTAAPPAGAPLARGVPRSGHVSSADGDARRIDLEVGRAVTLLSHGPKPIAIELSLHGHALDLPATPGAAPFFVPPATGSYLLRVRGPEGAPYVVAVLPGGLSGTPDGDVPESRP